MNININNYRDYFYNEYDFQIYIYYTLLLKGFNVYIDRDIFSELSSDYSKKLYTEVKNIGYRKYKLEKGDKKESGRPDMLLDISHIAGEPFFIAIEVKYPKDTKIKPIMDMGVQVQNFKGNIYNIDNLFVSDLDTFLLTPLTWFKDVKYITDWGKLRYAEDERALIFKAHNNMLLQCLHGLSGVGTFGRRENKVCIYSLHKKLTFKEIVMLE